MTKIESAIRNPQSAIYWWIALALLALLTYFLGLNLPLLGPDEPRYAQVAREMFDKGDWVTPTLGGFTWFEKPALLYWLEIASFYIFGVGEFAARFGSALFGSGTIASLWILGKNVSEPPAAAGGLTSGVNNKSDFANWLALIASSTLGVLVFSHGASFDMNITFPMTAALVSFFIFDQETSRQNNVQPPATAGGSDLLAASRRRRVAAPLVLFYFFIGVALLAKGLIGIIFPFAIVAFYHLLSWKWPSGTLIASLVWGTAVAVAVASVWYVPVYMRNGWPFIDEFFIQHHFQRFTTNKFQHPQPFYFFLWVLPLMTLPWLPFLIGSIWSFVREKFHHRATENTEINRTSARNYPPFSPSALHPFSSSPLLLFSLAWLLVPLVFFSFSGSKLPGYILPSVPPAIVLTAIYVFRLVEKSTKWRTVVLALAASVFVVSIGLVLFAAPRFAETDSVRGLLATATERGYLGAPVYCMHTISHSAEFYAAGRLLRDPDGKQKKLYSPAEVVTEMQRAGVKHSLVLIPIEYQKQLTDSPLMKAEILTNNTDLAIAAVAIE